MDFGVRMPTIVSINYPIEGLNPKAKGNIIVGKKASLGNGFEEHKNMAIAALASASIMSVAASIAAYMVLPFLITAFSTSALILSAGGGAYFVTLKLLDPRSKIENLKEQFRDALLQRVLQKSTDDVEGYDLLEKAIEDRTQDSNVKASIYLCLRQLRRNHQQIEHVKKSNEKRVNELYDNYFENLSKAKNRRIKNIYQEAISDHEKENKVSDVKSAYKLKVSEAGQDKSYTINITQEQYQDAIKGLEKQYENLLNSIGTKQGFARVLEIGVKGGRIIGENGKKIGSAIGWGFYRTYEMSKWVKAQF